MTWRLFFRCKNIEESGPIRSLETCVLLVMAWVSSGVVSVSPMMSTFALGRYTTFGDS